MSRNWLIGVGVGLVATAALVTVGVTAYELGGRGTEQVVVTGSESVGGRIIVDHDGWRHGPGPGVLIVPLLIVGGIFLLSSRRRRGWCGPGSRSGPWGPGPRRDHHDRYWDERADGEHDDRERDDWERGRRPDRPVDAAAASAPAPSVPPASAPADPAP